ncbi:MAG: site-specific DNA-methyltransferase, partial [Gemmatimonadaceae bacterium]
MAAKKNSTSTTGKPAKRKSESVAPPATAQSYEHAHADLAARPEAGTQAQFRKKKAPTTYRYDSSLAPELTWDGANAAVRDRAEELLRTIEAAASEGSPEALQRARDAAQALRALQQPFLNWTGKAERLSFDVATLPLFVHERLSTEAILDTLTAHKKDQQVDLFDLFADPKRPVADQVLRAYEHRDKWTNRMILGDSLVVMNSLLQYEGMGGQVQMIYIDPPYGVKYNGNFQPFVRKRDGKPSGDDDLTREPEMVQAYRDTWELGLHSYLTYLRDRLLLAKDLLTPSGSVFVQISDENLHHVREVMDEVFGAENFVSQIAFLKTSGFESKTLSTLNDSILWYARDRRQVKARKLFERQEVTLGEGNATWLFLPDGTYRGVRQAEVRGEVPPPAGALPYKPDNIVSQGAASDQQPFAHEGKTYLPPPGSHWKANYPVGMQRLADAGRVHVAKNSIQFRRFVTDFAFQEIGNVWTDTRTGNFTDDKLYVVQTASRVVARCVLLSTDPGDLVLDPTCGSG